MPTDSNAKNTQTRVVTNTPERNVSIAKNILLGDSYRLAGEKAGVSGARASQVFSCKMRQLRHPQRGLDARKGLSLDEIPTYGKGMLEKARANSKVLVPMLGRLLKSGIVK